MAVPGHAAGLSRHHLPVPDSIPGIPVYDTAEGEYLFALKGHLANLCQLKNTRFPGSQPVSFRRESLDALEREDFWVCEKSDGVRVLVMITGNRVQQDVYLIDRKEEFYHLPGLSFPNKPNADNPGRMLSDTVLDGELVIDVDGQTGRQTLCLLAFDCLVINGRNIMQRPLLRRYGALKDQVIAPYDEQRRSHPQFMQNAPLRVKLKPQELSYGIIDVIKSHIPRLQHGNDGLIFTSAEASYTPGTDHKILKWKPASENSVDFLLRLRFPHAPDGETKPDFGRKPLFLLYMNCGRDHEYFDVMDVSDAQWQEWKNARQQIDEKIVEVAWDKESENWQFLRFREDKAEGNFHTIVDKILESIKDGVEVDDLQARAPRIKRAWKERQAQREQASRSSAQAAAKTQIAAGAPDARSPAPMAPRSAAIASSTPAARPPAKSAKFTIKR